MGVKRPSKPIMSVKRPVAQPNMGPKAAAGAQGFGVQGVAAPAAAAPGGPPPSQGLPVDPQFDASIGAADRARARALAEITAQRASLGSTYGMGVNAQGGVFDDPSNPFSRAAVLKLLYDRRQQGNTNAMAARGQLYSGALQTEQNTAASDNARQRDALIREFLSANGQLTAQELATNDAYTDATTNAGADRIARAVANRPDAASVPQNAPVSVKPPFKSEPGKDSQGRPGTWHIYPDGRKVFVRR
jgi:hypothetical protein